MNTENTTDNTDETRPRPFGFWLRTVDHLLAREFETAFEAEGITRRDWRLLNLLDDAPERAGRVPGHKLRRLAERGWIAETDGAWTLTEAGRAAKERLAHVADGIRARVSGTVSDEDFATTMATLEAIAHELGWDPSERMPRSFAPGSRRGFGRGFGPGHREDFGPGEDSTPHDRGFRGGFGGHRPHFGAGFGAASDHRGHAFGPGDQPCHPHPHRTHARGDRAERTQRAYERGFDAGFARGREAHGA
ncbi:MAG: hypothetical protein QM622_08690 [Microbacterium sp.]